MKPKRSKATDIGMSIQKKVFELDRIFKKIEQHMKYIYGDSWYIENQRYKKY